MGAKLGLASYDGLAENRPAMVHDAPRICLQNHCCACCLGRPRRGPAPLQSRRSMCWVSSAPPASSMRSLLPAVPCSCSRCSLKMENTQRKALVSFGSSKTAAPPTPSGAKAARARSLVTVTSRLHRQRTAAGAAPGAAAGGLGNATAHSPAQLLGKQKSRGSSFGLFFSAGRSLCALLARVAARLARRFAHVFCEAPAGALRNPLT